jgi:large subunit ribosomal protein L21
MYAVIQTGGKQYRVQPGEMVYVEKLDAEEGATVELGDVLLVADGEKVRVGTPNLPGVKVIAEVKDQARDKKVVVFKFRRRKGYHRKHGHRQPYTALMVKEIVG